jgi:hypothetical protein
MVEVERTSRASAWPTFRKSMAVVFVALAALVVSVVGESLEYWPASVVQELVSAEPVSCQTGILLSTQITVRLAGDHGVWVSLRVAPSAVWELSEPGEEVLREPVFLRAGPDSEAVYAATWRLAREPLLSGNNLSVAMELPEAEVFVALTNESSRSSPLRTLRSAAARVELRLVRPRDTLRYVVATVASLLVCCVLYLAASRRLSGLEATLGARLADEERRAAVAPDAVVGGVRIFSGRGKPVRRFGPKKE